MKNPAVYIMANKRNGTIYTGVTSNLSRRAWEHREALVSGFMARYGCKFSCSLKSTIPCETPSRGRNKSRPARARKS
jgi:predicted GIY-YIG superfamily endonuclease